ncbi:molybdenum cofactor synthesis 3 [Tieghemostelium lacteum]|uniref:Phosphatidate cytidylyltransferase, mitochondrial n=1 Tax=Tieghemostelium lacteum TaxID=361077 RepID=A0A151ZIV1_TIELA|nr:molybdenum cofactor synthesis 3 [Tieghemostelium lacteum]|eukprot:KYQ93928.1 molybdenum cofactor synthesis 3 [Tieghemostelium lacteum]
MLRKVHCTKWNLTPLRYYCSTNNKFIIENQQKHINKDSVEKINILLKQFPKIKYAFAYGSAVVNQKGYESTTITTKTTNDNQLNNKNSSPMIDLVFAVDNSIEWHKDNIQKNSDHYSFFAYIGSKLVTYIQKTSAKIYYNSLLTYKGINYKYGVIEYSDMVSDLKNWDSIYVAGRMQKPYYEITESSEIRQLNCQFNIKFAIAASLLMLPTEFTEYQLFHKISSISYLGDIRMNGGENPNKVHNLLINNIHSFREIYYPIIKQHFSYLLFDDQLISNIDIQYMINKQLQQNLSNSILFKYSNNCSPVNIKQDLLDKFPSHLKNEIISSSIEKLISRRVKKHSLYQSLKGIFSAGILKSIYYVKLKNLLLMNTNSHNLENIEIERYSRQLITPGIGVDGQMLLKKSQSTHCRGRRFRLSSCIISRIGRSWATRNSRL